MADNTQTQQTATLEPSSATTIDGASQNMLRSAFVLGYTGETGKELVKELIKCDDINKLVLIGRREVTLQESSPKIEQKTIDFEKPEEFKSVFEGCSVGYSCLGTTRGKAGKEGFIKVDKDYVINTARVAKEAGCQHLHLLTASNANKNSWFLYPQVKGQVEEEIKALDFPRLSIYRPALLLCDREEGRPGERLIRALARPIAAASPTLMSCPTSILAQAMVVGTLRDTGVKVDQFSNKDIHMLAAGTYFKDKK